MPYMIQKKELYEALKGILEGLEMKNHSSLDLMLRIIQEINIKYLICSRAPYMVQKKGAI